MGFVDSITGVYMTSHRNVGLLTAIRWAIVTPVLIQLLGFARTMLLARGLGPTEYSYIAIATLAMTTTAALSQIGTRFYLIQVARLTEDVIHAAWSLEALKGLLLALFMYGLSPLIANWLHAPYAQPAIQIAALTLGVSACVSLQQIKADKELHLAQSAKLNLFNVVLDLCVCLAGLAMKFNARQILEGLLASQMIKTLYSHVQVKRCPALRLNVDLLRPLVKFGGWISLSTMLSFLATQLDQFLVAKVLGGKQLAGYQIAGLIAAIPMISLSTPISTIIFPTLCRVQNDKPAFKRTVAASLTAMMVLGVAMLIAAPFAMPLVFRVALREEWMFATPATITLFAAQIFRPPLSVLESSWLALGQARQGLWIQFIRACAVIICIPWYQSASSLLDIAFITFVAGLVATVLCMALAFRTGVVELVALGGRWLATHIPPMTLFLSYALTQAANTHAPLAQGLGMVIAPLAYLAMTWLMAVVTGDQVTLQIIRDIRPPLKSK